MAARSPSNSVEYGNSKTTTLLPSAKCTRPLFQGRTGCGGRPSGWHDVVTCQRLVINYSLLWLLLQCGIWLFERGRVAFDIMIITLELKDIVTSVVEGGATLMAVPTRIRQQGSKRRVT